MPATLDWRSARALARVEPIVEPLVAEHATSYWGRGARSRVLDDGRVLWTIDGEPVLELRFAARGPSELVVHDFSLFTPVRRSLRSRHVRVRFATFRDQS